MIKNKIQEFTRGVSERGEEKKKIKKNDYATVVRRWRRWRKRGGVIIVYGGGGEEIGRELASKVLGKEEKFEINVGEGGG